MYEPAMAGFLEIIRDREGDHSGLFDIFHQNKDKAIVGDTGTRAQGTEYTRLIGDGQALLYIDGPITPRADWFSEMSGMVSIEKLSAEFMALRDNPDITRIIPMFDTPGGAVTGVSELAQLFRSSKKPVDGFVYGHAASGGLWLAAGCHSIQMADTAGLGSLGVLRTVYKPEKDSNTLEILSTYSPNKRVDPTTKAGKAEHVKNVDQLCSVFIDAVADYRDTTREDVMENYGKGSMIYGPAVVEIGMADKITTLDAMINDFGTNKKNKQTTGETSMAGEKPTTPTTTPTVTAAAPPAPVVDQGAAVAAEHQRMREIEGVAASVANMGPGAQKIASDIIAEAKYDSSKTAASVAMEVLTAVNSNQATVQNAVVTAARAVDGMAPTPPPAPETKNTEQQETEAAVAGLVEAAGLFSMDDSTH
jgi:ClpP class serine protease